MTSTEIDQLPVGALLSQPKCWGLLVVTANNPADIEVIHIGYSKVFLPPSPRPRPQEFRLHKYGREVDLVRIA
jgi:hypothetical protein